MKHNSLGYLLKPYYFINILELSLYLIFRRYINEDTVEKYGRMDYKKFSSMVGLYKYLSYMLH